MSLLLITTIIKNLNKKGIWKATKVFHSQLLKADKRSFSCEELPKEHPRLTE